MFAFSRIKKSKFNNQKVGKDINHIRIVIENVFLCLIQHLNNETAPVNALKPDGFCALSTINSCFVV